MSGAIAYIVYGIPLNEKHEQILEAWENGETWDQETWERRKPTQEEEDEMELAGEDGGFTTVYSAYGGREPGYCGVLLGRLSEGGVVHLEELMASRWKPSPAQKEQAQALVNDLPKSIREVADPVGLYLVWGSS